MKRAWQLDTVSFLVPGLDLALGPLMSSSTMIFAPRLDYMVLFEYVSSTHLFGVRIHEAFRTGTRGSRN